MPCSTWRQQVHMRGVNKQGYAAARSSAHPSSKGRSIGLPIGSVHQPACRHWYDHDHFFTALSQRGVEAFENTTHCIDSQQSSRKYDCDDDEEYLITPPHQHHHHGSTGRRSTALGIVASALTMAAAASRPACAEETIADAAAAAAAASSTPSTATTSAALSLPPLTYNSREYTLTMPADFLPVVPGKPSEQAGQSSFSRPPPSAEEVAKSVPGMQLYGNAAPAPPPEGSVAIRFANASGEESVGVVVRGSSTIKPTFLQVNDIPDLCGSLSGCANVLLPSEVEGEVVAGAEDRRGGQLRDTGSVIGQVKGEERTYYTYEFKASAPPSALFPEGLKDRRAIVRIAAARGKIYAVVASAPASSWDSNGSGARLRSIVGSFRVKDSAELRRAGTGDQ